MCNYALPKQFAYIDPEGKFRRLGTPIESTEHLQTCIEKIPNIAKYLSVYGWTGWKGGKVTPEISKTAIIDGIFFDFDDKEHPENALADAAEVAQYVGHATCNFSGAKGAHVLINCNPVDLIPDLKSSVLRRFANMLADHLPELTTMDWAVIGDTSRVHRIIDSVHPKTKLHAIGLTMEELSTLTIDEIRGMAANRRGLIQIPEPSQWVSQELYRIEGEILIKRLFRLKERNLLGEKKYREIVHPESIRCLRPTIHAFVQLLEKVDQETRAKNAPNTEGLLGRSPEETWLMNVLQMFKVVGRMNSIQPAGSKVSTSPSEHEARCHITHLMADCGWDKGQMHEVFSYADDYNYTKTERMINSLIKRV